MVRPVVLMTLAGALALAYLGTQAHGSPTHPVVAGYLPEYRSYINLNNTAQYLTDVILFSLTPNEQGGLGPCCLESHHFAQAHEARAYKEKNFPDKEKLRIWVSVGGAGRSNAFAKVAGDTLLRAKFLESLKNLCVKKSIDGVDFDWEAPQTLQQYKDYAALLEDASRILRGDSILVSVALHPRQVFPKPFSYDAVDVVNLMTYDMITQGNHHAAPKQVKAAADFLLDAGCPASKIVLGIPAYARHGNNPGEVKTYSEIVDRVLESEPLTNQEIMTKLGQWNGYFFDSPSLVSRKVQFAAQNKMAGVFFWELGQDKQHEELGPGGMLLEAAQPPEGLKKNAYDEL